MRRIISQLTAPGARAPLLVFAALILYVYASWPVEKVQDLVIQGSYAYLAMGEDGIRILDLSDPEAPREVAHYDTGGFAHSVAITDRYLYVASGRDGLRVVDVTLHDRLREVSRIGARGSVEKVIISGNFAFLVDTRSGVRVLSLHQPYQPVELAALPTRSQITAIAASGQMLVAANSNRGGTVFDLSNPYQPQERGEFFLPATALDLATDGRYIYAAAGDRGIVVLDASNPAAIQEVSHFTTRGPALGIDRFATFGFVSMGPAGVEVFDLSNPRSLRSIGSYTGISPVLNTFAAHQRAYLAADVNGVRSISYQVRMEPVQAGMTGVPPVILDVEVQGNLAFLAAGDAGLRVLNVGNPSLPYQVHEFDTQGYAAHILVSGDLAFIADQAQGIVAVDISNLNVALQPVSVMPTTFQANSLVKSGNLIYSAEGAGGLRILNYRNPYEPEEISRLVTGGLALDVAVTSDYAYVADGIGGLKIIYTGNPADPKLQSVLDTPGDARAVFVEEVFAPTGRTAYAYVADGSRGLRIVNISDPRSPFSASTLEITGFAQDVAVLGSTAYLAMGDKGIALVDVSDPAQPLYLGHFDTPGEAFSLLVKDNLIYVADHSRGLAIIRNAADTSLMSRTGMFDAPHSVVASYADDTYAYVTDGELGLWTLDFSQPAQIRTVGLEPLAGQPGQMRMTDLDTLLVAAGDAGVHFIDLGDPRRPLRLATLDTPGTALGVEARGFQGYVADGLNGIHIIDFLTPEQPQIVSSLNTDGIAFDIAVSGEYAFVADGPAGLLAVRVRDLRNPAKVSVMPTLREARAVEVVGPYAFVAAGVDGLRVINIEHPLTMEEVAHQPVEGRAVDVQISGSYAFVASDQQGLSIFDISDPVSPLLVGETTEGFPAASVTIFNQSRSSSQPRAFQALMATGQNGLRVYDVNEIMALARMGHYDTPGTATLGQMVDAAFLLAAGQVDQVPAKVVRTFFQVLLDLGLFGFVSFFIWLFAIGQFVLPISSRNEYNQLRQRLVAYLFGDHGPAVRVREGKLIQSSADTRRRGKGVALVDLSSAIVLEPPLVSAPAQVRPSILGSFRGPRRRSQPVQEPGKAPAITVKGPGIVFTGSRWNERVRSVVDLRPQIRFQTKISAHTRDLIEVNCNVLCIFTLGEEPTIYQVAYDGDPSPENVRILRLKEKVNPPERPGGPEQKVKVVDQLVDELDELDRAEVHRYIQTQARHMLPAGDASDLSARLTAAPFVFDEERVFAAVYSQALDASSGTVVDWDQLPSQVAVDEFRDFLWRYKYDDLYSRVEDPNRFPLPDLKNKFNRRVKNLGVMSFQYVRRLDHQPILEKQVIPANELVYYPVQKFQSPKVLRVRGIKVITASFSELRPAHAEVRRKQMEKWRAGWEKDIEGAEAEFELEAARIRNMERAQAQHSLAVNLNELMKCNQFSDEALAVRVYQALESAAADPETRKLLPGEAVAMLNNLRSWLAPDQPQRPLLIPPGASTTGTLTPEVGDGS